MIIDLFSKRQSRLRGEAPDVYTYDDIPKPLRVQIVHIFEETLGDQNDYHGYGNEVKTVYRNIVEKLCREYGLFTLNGAQRDNRNYRKELIDFILVEPTAEKIMDAVELASYIIERYTSKYEYLRNANASMIAKGAIEELNTRFREHGVGYQINNGEVIRVDSELLHAEVVKPALALLRGKEYAGAQAEFLGAHEHYRHGNTKEALAEALKSLESTMKAICDKRKWDYPANATANPLIEVCIKNGLIPEFWAKHFSGIRSTLESGVPTVRNRLGGHGQGTEVVEVPLHIVSYVLHMAAATIVFLVEAEKALG
ncbi:hypothetical protein D9X30_1069 [Cupriavidus sp. U2]|uniref:STM4504/CBY_0614 family protein n=1 Tax=Cupriavidus sp. U2 TaxID=2920269 RepID=UPI001ED4B62A|nr:hypothetical protein [Cupriavidus sp. U2]KAI3593894.1 hypothetical protein D9X30_1069 [Cupriavidus sp. U2]